MSIKAYNSRGRLNYKAVKLRDELQAAIDKKASSDKLFETNWRPATTEAELKEMHQQYCTEEATILSETTNGETEKIPSVNNAPKDPADDDNFWDEEPTKREFIDPLNKEEPLVRDYVLKDEYADVNAEAVNAARTSFDEPVTFNGAFTIPSVDDDSQVRQQGGEPSPKNNAEPNKQPQGKQKQGAQQPINPVYDEQANATKNKQNKRWAKYIVEAVAFLAKEGCIWWSTNNINEHKLAQYETNGEIDLTMLLTLSETQQCTVKEFFQMQCAQAKTVFDFSVDEKKDLTDALVEFMNQKGFAPDPTQNLLITAAVIVGQKAFIAFKMGQQNNELLRTLKQMTSAAIAEDDELEAKIKHRAEQRAAVEDEINNTPPAQNTQPVETEIISVEAETMPLVKNDPNGDVPPEDRFPAIQ